MNLSKIDNWKFRECWESNPGLLGDKQTCYLCSMQPPDLTNFSTDFSPPHPIPPRPRCGSRSCNGAASLSPGRLKQNKKPNMDQNRKSKSFMENGWRNVGQSKIPSIFLIQINGTCRPLKYFFWLGHKLGFYIYCFPYPYYLDTSSQWHASINKIAGGICTRDHERTVLRTFWLTLK